MSLIRHESGWFTNGVFGNEAVHVWVDMTLQSLPPDVIEMARICALPARFDARLFILLTGRSEIEAIATISQLVAAGLAVRQNQSSYVYHTAARDILRQAWHAPDRAARYNDLANRLGGYYLMLVYEQVLRLNGPGQTDALAALDRLYPNVRAAFHALVATHNWPMIADFASLMDIYHAHRLRWEENAAWLREGIAACQHLDDVEGEAALQNSLGVTTMQVATGDDGVTDEVTNARRAVAAYRRALEIYSPEAAPLDYAMVQNNLGNAYTRLAAGDDAVVHLHRAIECYTEAARYWTAEIAPLSYAMVQNNMGNAYTALTAGNRQAHLRRAIACYRKALKIYATKVPSPGYAELQFKLGKTYAALPSGWHSEKRSENLRQTIACYRAVLSVYSIENAPLAHAETQLELGNVYMQLNDGDRAENLQLAIGCYKKALRVWLNDTASTGALQPAIAQEKLTSAYLDLARLYIAGGQTDSVQALYREIQQLYADDRLA